jgi:cytochrome c biogenesis protein CcdA
MRAALLVAMQAGILAGLGPCTISRAFALRSLTANNSDAARWCRTLAFGCGLIAGYVAFGGLWIAFARAVDGAIVTYAVIAILCVAGGVATLWRAGGSHRCLASPRATDGWIGGAFMIGAGCTLIGSPCCGPLSAALAGGATLAYPPREAALLLAAYAFGHVVPVLAVLFAGERLGAALRKSHGLTDSVAGGVMLGLGGYYAVLA